MVLSTQRLSSLQQVHAGACDFTRFTHLGYRHLFRGFQRGSQVVLSGARGMALAWSLRHFLMSFTNNPLSRVSSLGLPPSALLSS